MNAKKVKRMCTVKGCTNTDCYAISKLSEYGGVIICKDCLQAALKAVENGGKSETKRKPASDVPLFFHPEQTVARTVKAVVKAEGSTKEAVKTDGSSADKPKAAAKSGGAK